MRRSFALFAAIGLVSAGAALAANPLEPPGILIPNYERVMLGSQGALEAGALIVRARAAEAGWFNPAGLVRGDGGEINGNASLYELVSTTFSDKAGTIEDTTSYLNTLAAFVGSANWIMETPAGQGLLGWGFTIATPVSWTTVTDSHQQFQIGGGDDIVTTSSATDLKTVAMGGSLSYKKSDRCYVGLSGLVYSTSLKLKKTKFDDWWNGTGDTWTWASDSQINVDTMHLGINMGFYYQASSNLEVGFVARLPGIMLSGNGRLDDRLLVVQDEPLGGTPTTPWDDYEYYQRDAHEEDVKVDWKIPLELDFGAAFSWEDGNKQIELDAKYHAGTSAFTVFPEGEYDVRTGTIGTPGVYTDGKIVRPTLTTETRQVCNLAIGYRSVLSDMKSFHAGFSTSFSPIKSGGNEDLFTPMDIYTFSIGVTSQKEKTATAIGVVMQLGTTDDFKLQDLGTLEYVRGSLSMTTLSLVMGARFKL